MDDYRFTYITVFSGCGGSALGLKQAGGKGLFALDFDPLSKTQNAYDHLVLNFPEIHDKGCILNEDIQSVSGERILELVGIRPRELDLYQSSAPCQGFSASNTARNAKDFRNDLFFESIKQVKVIQPAIALFENVAGMTMGKMRGKFVQIVGALRDCGYKVGAWSLNASDYGAPQTRPRTWIIGIRDDIGFEPSVPAPIGYVVGVKDVLPHIVATQQGQFNKTVFPANNPCCTITKTEGMKVIDNTNSIRKPTIEELRVLSTFPSDFKFTGTHSQIHARLGNSVLPLMIKRLAIHLYNSVLDPYHSASNIHWQSQDAA
jgi:DNA (cytosine-5)-methyltransferase 1